VCFYFSLWAISFISWSYNIIEPQTHVTGGGMNVTFFAHYFLEQPTLHNLIARDRFNLPVDSSKLLNFPIFLLCLCDPTRVMASSFLRFLDHTQRRTTVGRTPLDELSAHRRDIYLTTHNNHNTHVPQWDSNPRSQQASGRRPTPYTARPLGSV